MGRFGTVVGFLAVLAAGGAHAAGELVGDAEFQTQILGAADGIVPAGPFAPWSSNGAIFRPQAGGQSYEVLVDGVEVGAFSTSAAPGFIPPRPALGASSPNIRHQAGVATAFALPKSAAWLLVIMGFGAIGLTLRGERRARVAAN